MTARVRRSLAVSVAAAAIGTTTLAAVQWAGASVVAPARSSSPSASSLGIGVSPSAAAWGKTFTISGTLECSSAGLAGVPVTVRRRPVGSSAWTTVATPVTGSTGGYSATDKPSASTDYEAVFGGNSTCAAVTSALARAGVRPGVTVNANPANPKAGVAVALSGQVLPAHPGRKVVLMVFEGGSSRQWKSVGSAVLDAHSAYHFSVRRSSAGYLLYRVGFPTQDADHLWNVSRSIKVTWS